MGDFSNDVKHAFRTFLKNPGFTIAAVAALALGIGADTAIFGVVNAVLLKPLSYPDADRIVEFGTRSSTLADFLSCVPEFNAYRRQTNVFKEVAAYDMAGPGFNLTGERPEQIRGMHVTEGYFRLFGAAVMLGRTFTPNEDAPHGSKLVVLSYGLWQPRFAADPAVVGKSLSLGSEPYTNEGRRGHHIRP
jgi:putative ABC transport system permease protein